MENTVSVLSQNQLLSSDFPTKSIAILGLPRSGTNFLRSVLEWNFFCNVEQNAYCWKHGFFPIVSTNSLFKQASLDLVFVTRNPFHAIHSLFSYYSKNGNNLIASQPFKAFLRSRIILHDSSQPSSPQYRFKNPVELWNDLNWNFASIKRNDAAQVHARYEDLMNAPEPTISRIASALNLNSKSDGIAIPSRRVRNMPARQATGKNFYVTNTMFDRTFFDSFSYMDIFDCDDADFMIDNIDTELVASLGYSADLEHCIRFSTSKAIR